MKKINRIQALLIIVIFSLSTVNVFAWNTPTQSSPSNGSDIWNALEFEWTPVTNSLAYQFQIDTVSSFNSAVMFDTTIMYVNSSGYDDTHLLMNQMYFGKTYHWRVRAYVANDTSAWSPVWNANTRDYLDLVSPMQASQNFVSVYFNWDSHPGVNYYDYQVDTTPNFNSPVLISGYNEYLSHLNGFADTETLIDNLRYGTTYFWRVRARNLVDESNWTTWSFVTKEYIIVDSPIQSAQVFSGTLLDWQAFDGATFYDYRVDTDLNFSSPILITGSNAFVANSSGNGDTEQYIEDLFFGTEYFWQVRSHNDVDTSDWSDGSLITIDIAEHSAPANYSLHECAVDIDWLASDGVDFYDYQVDITTSFNSPDLIVGEKTYLNNQSNNDDTHMLIEPLKFSTTYFWRVRLRNATDTSMWSDPWEFSTSDTIQLVSPYSTANVFTSINLNWADFSGVDYYNLEVDISPNFNSSTLSTFTVYNSSNQQLSNLHFGWTYYWRVQGVNLVDESTWSETWSFYTYDEVGLFTPADGALNQDYTAVYLDWWYHEGAIEYLLEIDTSNMFNTGYLFQETFSYLAPISGGTDTEYTTDTLENDKIYFWRVRAINEIDSSNWSERWFSTGNNTLVLPDAPMLLSPLFGQQDVDLSTTLDWTDATNATEYFYEYASNPNFDNSISGFTPVSEVPITGLDFESTYYWKVRASNGNLLSEWTLPYHFTTSHEVLEMPILITPADASSGNPTDVLSFDWHDVFHAQSYVIEYSTWDNFLFDVVTDTVMISEYLATGLDAQTTYYWHVMTMNDSIENSEWCDIWSFDTQLMLEIPVHISPANSSMGNNYNNLVVSWEVVSFADDYEIEVAKDMNFTVDVISSITVETYYIFPTLEPQTTYFWHVKAKSATYSPSDWSTFWMFTTKDNIGIDEIDGNNVLIYPNPSAGVFNIKGEGIIQIDIFNSLGQQISSYTHGEDKIDLSNFDKGIYYARVKTSVGVLSKKLVVK